ncbi:hypothetical protein AVEN_249240-1 [Araneus ventricosus]|uniref:Reverse transcriptase domain-containing protein n=1 Tax=Araneus ventricosus TaxID=182803 RepID=A0A4Y2MMF9_ARAVE|nr:hypothetical protein AVEN_249240-1 [Araneus ventricosus]
MKDFYIQRNEVGNLYKKLSRLKKCINADPDAIRVADLSHKRERTIFNKLLLETKRKAWKDYYKSYNEKLGYLFKLVFNKLKSKCEATITPNNKPNSTIKEKMQYIMNEFFPGDYSNGQLSHIPIIEEVKSLNEKELELVCKNLKKGKALGLDGIDYQIWLYLYNFDKIFLLDIANTCFKFNYFPQCLRNVRVFFLLKAEKDPGVCSSYRPVCLMPTIGKILERLFLNRFNRWLRENNILHERQYGFREGRSREVAIHDLIHVIKQHRKIEHTALISLDIKSASDNMD